MIISHKHKFVFMHNPKVAGSAIRQVLVKYHDDPVEFWHQKFFPELDRVVDAAHLTYHDLTLVRPEVTQNGYRFITVIRNPYERFVSSVGEFMRQHPEYVDPHFTLRGWCEQHVDETNFRFNWKYIHFCPQHYFVPPGTDLEMVYIIRHKNLGNVWPSLLEQLGLPHEDLPKVRVRPDVEGTPTVKDLGVYERMLINRVYDLDFNVTGPYEERETDESLDPSTHYERVNAIHSPYLAFPEEHLLSAGELIAYKQQRRL